MVDGVSWLYQPAHPKKASKSSWFLEFCRNTKSPMAKAIPFLKIIEKVVCSTIHPSQYVILKGRPIFRQLIWIEHWNKVADNAEWSAFKGPASAMYLFVDVELFEGYESVQPWAIPRNCINKIKIFHSIFLVSISHFLLFIFYKTIIFMRLMPSQSLTSKAEQSYSCKLQNDKTLKSLSNSSPKWVSLKSFSSLKRLQTRKALLSILPFCLSLKSNQLVWLKFVKIIGIHKIKQFFLSIKIFLLMIIDDWKARFSFPSRFPISYVLHSQKL